MLGGAVLWIPLIVATAVAVPVSAPESRGLVVTLAWDAPVDLDLYVTDPSWATVYYARREGHLTADARCVDGRPSAQTERAHWTDPPPGRYRVGVDFPEACAGDHATASFRLVIDQAGVRREVSGTARRGERQPVVVEIDVP
jgi:uncharacterized protein YfaP (DUF2135 family)